MVKEERACSEHRGLTAIEGTMQIAWQAEIGLAEIDERIAHADRNINQLASLIPELAIKGYSTTDIEDHLALMRTALHHLRRATTHHCGHAGRNRTTAPDSKGNGKSSAPNHDDYDFGFRPDRAGLTIARDLCMAGPVVSPLLCT